MNDIVLPTLSDILAEDDSLKFSNFSSGIFDDFEENHQIKYLKAQKEWYSGVQSVNYLLEEIRLKTYPELIESKSNYDSINFNSISPLGLMISGPVPVLIHPHLAIHFATQIFTHDISKLGDEFVLKLRHPLALLPASDGTSTSSPMRLET